MKASNLKPGGGVMQTAVKERPILFSGPMVRAILDGRKTQTRRIIKPQPSWIESSARWHWRLPKRAVASMCCDSVVTASREWHEYLPDGCCPYGQVGDRLWVRERHWYRATDGIITYADGSFRTHPSAIIGSKYVHESDVINWPEDAKRFGFKCVPSIHMPRWASRITLEITGVRVERLKQITDNDIAAEGIESLGSIPGTGGPSAGQFEGKYSTLRRLFSGLWVEINGDGSWAANPWVWVIEFQRKESDQ